MKDGVAASHGSLKRYSIPQVSGGRLSSVQLLKVMEIAGGTHKQAQTRPLIRENASDMGAEKSGSACNECFQEDFYSGGVPR